MACLQRLVALRHSSRIVARPSTVRFFNSTSANLDEKDARPADAGKNAPLTFEQYRELKNKVKTRSRIAGIPLGMLGMFSASFSFALMYPDMFDPPDPANPTLIFGMDPIFASVIASSTAGVCSFVAGGGLHRALWGLFNRDLSRQLKQRDEDFLRRIAKHRVEGAQKQEDDYYGEKITTLTDYRKWLKDQRKKRMPPDDTKLEWRKKPVGF